MAGSWYIIATKAGKPVQIVRAVKDGGRELQGAALVESIMGAEAKKTHAAAAWDVAQKGRDVLRAYLVRIEEGEVVEVQMEPPAIAPEKGSS